MTSKPAVQPVPATNSGPAARQLVVGREIILTGEIASCEGLVVEGTVRANIECQDLRIEASGLFAGSALVRNAEIFGRLEGELVVTERLNVRASGKVLATVRYHEIEIDRGGEISGDLQAQAATEQATGVVSIPA